VFKSQLNLHVLIDLCVVGDPDPCAAVPARGPHYGGDEPEEVLGSARGSPSKHLHVVISSVWMCAYREMNARWTAPGFAILSYSDALLNGGPGEQGDPGAQRTRTPARADASQGVRRSPDFMRHLTRRELLNAYEAMPREQKEAVKAAEQSTHR
jgi:hypothetical protein